MLLIGYLETPKRAWEVIVISYCFVSTDPGGGGKLVHFVYFLRNLICESQRITHSSQFCFHHVCPRN